MGPIQTWLKKDYTKPARLLHVRGRLSFSVMLLLSSCYLLQYLTCDTPRQQLLSPAFCRLTCLKLSWDPLNSPSLVFFLFIFHLQADRLTDFATRGQVPSPGGRH